MSEKCGLVAGAALTSAPPHAKQSLMKIVCVNCEYGYVCVDVWMCVCGLCMVLETMSSCV